MSFPWLLLEEIFLALWAGRLGLLTPRGGATGSLSSDLLTLVKRLTASTTTYLALELLELLGTVLASVSWGVEMQWNNSIKTAPS